MLVGKTKYRIRYADTDQMGHVYHGNYASFYEIGRTELFRSIGIPYQEIEKSGLVTPVIDLECKFKKPAHYDELITITTRLINLPVVRIKFIYEIHNSLDELLNTGSTTLAIISTDKKRPVKIPEKFLNVIQKHFKLNISLTS